MKKILTSGLVLLLCAALLLSCTPMQGLSIPDVSAPAAERPEAKRLQIVTTIFPYYDFARAVAGDFADVTLLIKPGTEIHTFDPAPADLLAIKNADLFIYNGGESEAWVEKVLSGAEMQSGAVLRMMDYVLPLAPVEPAHDHEDEDEEEPRIHAADEHIWTSPYNAAALLDVIAQAMMEADTANAARYRENADEYRVQIAAVTAQIKQTVEAAAVRHIVVADRFPFLYFTQAFGLTYDAAFPGCDVQGDASPAVVLSLIETVREQELSAIFIAELSSGRAAETISEETDAEILTLHSCQNVTKDEFEGGATYVSLMQDNAAALQKALA